MAENIEIDKTKRKINLFYAIGYLATLLVGSIHFGKFLRIKKQDIT